MPVGRQLESARRALAVYLAASPGTYVLFLVVAVTTLVLRGTDVVTVSRILRHQSTNLIEMSRDAPRVLFLSAFLLDNGNLIKELVLFTVVFAPVERWIGTYRWMGVFVAGHVGATIATTVGIWLQVRAGIGGRQLAYPVDVGVSYGLAAVAGVLAFRLPRPFSALFAVGLLGNSLFAVAHTGTFTDWGHLSAVLIGFALAPLVRPASPGPARWRSGLARAGAALLLGSAVTLCVVLVAVDTDIEILPPQSTLTATVIEGPLTCGPGCQDVPVRLGSASSSPRASLRLPAGTEASIGTRLQVVPVRGRSGQVRLVGQARRVHLSGLLGEVAVAAAGAGLVLLFSARSNRRTEVAAAGTEVHR
jgi:hypothetical protein